MQYHQIAQIVAESYHYHAFNINECEGIIHYLDDVQIVAFRGTEIDAMFSGGGWIDVIRDMRILPWYDKDAGWVHSGFLKGARGVAEFLMDVLEPDKPVLVTGHSLGAALALMVAVKLEAAGVDVQEWVGFGSPKVQIGYKDYPFRQVSFKHKADIVPLMPRLPFYQRSGIHHQLGDGCGKPNWNDHAVELYVEVLKQQKI